MAEDNTLQGTIPTLASTDERKAALDQAFDYRGDVTIETNGGDTIAGYIFDRRNTVAEPYVRLMPSDGSATVEIQYSAIKRLVFSGRDTAAGKSWETWLKKYSEKKARGESTDLHPDSLDDA